jgi:two-component system, sporulation sensor kinase E
MLNMVCTPMDDVATGRSIGGLMVIEDVTARLTMERRLAVSERLAAVGKLAAKVAHELNNPLDGIMRYLNLAIRVSETPGTPAEPEKVVRYLTEARKGLTRMVQILGELLEFSRSSYGTYEEANVNRYVEDAVNAMQDKALHKSVNIVCRMDGVMPGVRVGSNLFQVYCNLIKNAIDAMPDGGTLTITTAQINREVVVAFEDTGVGLPENTEQIFQPFFTTKPSGQGTGLGLAICKDIIEKYNGRILAENRPEGGARFTVIVPIEGGAVAAAR